MVILNGIQWRHSAPTWTSSLFQPGFAPSAFLHCEPSIKALISKTHPLASGSFVWLLSVVLLRKKKKKLQLEKFCIFYGIFICLSSFIRFRLLQKPEPECPELPLMKHFPFAKSVSQDEPSPPNETIAAWSAAWSHNSANRPHDIVISLSLALFWACMCVLTLSPPCL